MASDAEPPDMLDIMMGESDEEDSIAKPRRPLISDLLDSPGSAQISLPLHSASQTPLVPRHTTPSLAAPFAPSNSPHEHLHRHASPKLGMKVMAVRQSIGMHSSQIPPPLHPVECSTSTLLASRQSLDVPCWKLLPFLHQLTLSTFALLTPPNSLDDRSLLSPLTLRHVHPSTSIVKQCQNCWTLTIVLPPCQDDGELCTSPPKRRPLLDDVLSPPPPPSAPSHSPARTFDDSNFHHDAPVIHYMKGSIEPVTVTSRMPSLAALPDELPIHRPTHWEQVPGLFPDTTQLLPMAVPGETNAASGSQVARLGRSFAQIAAEADSSMDDDEGDSFAVSRRCAMLRERIVRLQRELNLTEDMHVANLNASSTVFQMGYILRDIRGEAYRSN
ncbi:hypothetical protein SCP_0211860 [Sparassis crispa]|uniref:Uncharacterized protein n=1 Tax=Sparassis crispa TaxID=139825 RepID=A0A401GCS8_9APHY|nr:hypothetical protein SCP_0211860 [Sparassis crispa]GBE79984.1 hypothetical protein SCP_0211860 [Sparassis crispa]